MRIVTINTWKNEGDYVARMGALAIGLGELRPDIVLMQEVFRTHDDQAHTGKTLAAELGLTLAYVPAREKPRWWQDRETLSESGLAVLVRGEIKQTERLPLPSDERGGERIALLVDALVAGSVVVRVGCTHLSHLRGDSARRREQLATILAHPRWREPAALRMLGGDFNTTLETPELMSLAEDYELRIADVFAATAEPRITHPMPGRKGGAGHCIDFLLTIACGDDPTPIVREARVALNAPIGNVWPSDHAAVFARVEV